MASIFQIDSVFLKIQNVPLRMALQIQSHNNYNDYIYVEFQGVCNMAVISYAWHTLDDLYLDFVNTNP